MADVFLPLSGPIQLDGKRVRTAVDGTVRVPAGTHDLMRQTP